MPICNKCQSKFPNRITIDGTERNLQNRKYCLSCSPFGTHNTAKLDQKVSCAADKRFCPRCKEVHPMENFYNRRGKLYSSVYCKNCTLMQTLDRQREFKEACVQYKGGECEECGYKKCVAALEFHHKDPTKKDFNISKARLHKMNEATTQELDKCILVCANCHREIHHKYARRDSNPRPTL